MEIAPRGLARRGRRLKGIAMAAPARTISFRDSVANRHGEVLRSSAIFYVPPRSGVRTRISFMNYWAQKRGLQVAVVASVRGMDGKLLSRERLRFDQGQVINFEPQVDEGSVEIEVFAADNMVIPYAAIIGWYETARGVSLVHSYARAYSSHEIEEGRVLTRGREGCWTIADDADTRSFCVFHNGVTAVAPQRLRLSVINSKGQRREAAWDIGELAPYQSLLVEPAGQVEGLAAFLDGHAGQAEIQFELGGGFTRMLVGNRRGGWDDLQVTHSNFNYTLQPTDMAGVGMAGWMEVPALPVDAVEVMVYPQTVQGLYEVDSGGDATPFRTGEQLVLPVTGRQTLRFRARQGEMPTRLVTAIRVHGGKGLLPNECSLGVLTSLQPPKRMWWGPLRCDDAARSQLLVHDLPQVYEGIGADAVLSMRLFSASAPEPVEVTWPASSLVRLAQGVGVDEIWPQAREFLAGEPGYFTLFCPYGGLTAYTLTRNDAGSVCLEHGF
jgi:hypothetical protein